MSRKKFIESQGATCANWQWSWSFVNEKDKFVIFGAWDTNTDGNTSLILDKGWEYSYKGRKSPAYAQAMTHIKLVQERGYILKTFPIIYSDELIDDNGFGRAKIKDFIPDLKQKLVRKIGASWYASDGMLSNLLPEEILAPAKYLEGTSKTISVNAYERNPKARQECIEHYGAICFVCSFDFKASYGEIGNGFIHVHHLIPLSEIRQQYELDPIRDLRPVCPNCHGIIHRTQPALTIEILKLHMNIQLEQKSE